MSLAFKNLQWLMCHKIKPNKVKLLVTSFLQVDR